ncbi:hypothetical protein [Pectobacterium aroidearum]|uniref:hypothetical protein n=1 Tax=Pectobacterium aroidearum TaxID=1201031 RepID=UPI0021146EA7|nr:hypothetical protein [Pectobacterium aroidearum]UUE44923.1 hypothetical protein L0Y28_20925 [Pectobacterium aroidearum]UUE49142.1 hypothetical protein L0Y23_20805 [Pectobacterium aroidearum]UUE53346.1 hypothetical protein L0Y30_20925 [Pectobacterium aroidearum]UUE61757.1 hypothetical protein L0Y29_20925 [Pectobacterium aroidearum]UUE65981.1 hypothetical protein L0Y22_20920 [Pectobacterium aroidearum]
MLRDATLSQAAHQADQLCVLLLLLEQTHEQLSEVDMATALGLARDLSDTPALWLLDEKHTQSQCREGNTPEKAEVSRD